jgi:hypothetical protein
MPDSSTGGGPDGSSAAACQAKPSYGTPTFGSAMQGAGGSGSGSSQYVAWQGELDTVPDILDIELYATSTAGVTARSNIDLSTENQYQTCDACVLIWTQVTQTGSGSAAMTNIGQFYLATSGTLNITSVSPNVTGTLQNAQFTHVTIDNSGTMPTYKSTPANDGCTSMVTSASFSAPKM